MCMEAEILALLTMQLTPTTHACTLHSPPAFEEGDRKKCGEELGGGGVGSLFSVHAALTIARPSRQAPTISAPRSSWYTLAVMDSRPTFMSTCDGQWAKENGSKGMRLATAGEDGRWLWSCSPDLQHMPQQQCSAVQPAAGVGGAPWPPGRRTWELPAAAPASARSACHHRRCRCHLLPRPSAAAAQRRQELKLFHPCDAGPTRCSKPGAGRKSCPGT